jgi:hypothetical protein
LEDINELWSKFNQKCKNEDSETEDAREMAKEIVLLDINGVVDFKPSRKEVSSMRLAHYYM